MTSRLLQRLLQMDRRELRDRTGAAARRARDRVRLRLQPPAWDRRQIGRVLSSSFQESGGMRRYVRNADWTAVHHALHRHYAGERARFLPGLRAADDTRHAIIARFPGAADQARLAAERLLDGTIDVLGYRNLRIAGRRSGEIDWHRDPVHEQRAPLRFWAAVPYLDPACGDHKIIWEINRHQHWLALGRAAWLTGDERYAAEIVRQLTSWLRQNPPLVGTNWASMLELGFRSLSWLWALAFCTGAAEPELPSHPWTIDLLVGLDAQLEHVRLNLSRYFSPNTHLLGEALALYVAGRSLPELANAERWARAGREILLQERTRQVNPDGGHAELSPHYHRYVLDFYMLALAVARASSDEAAQDAFEEVARKLARYMRAICDDCGRMPLIGDDDGGQAFPICGREASDVTPSLACAAALLNEPRLAIDHLTEEAIWLAGPAARISSIIPSPDALATTERRVTVASFPETGYHVARTCQRDHLVFDAGRHGFLNGGHAHADALEVVLTSRARPLLIDPGTSTYTMSSEVRDRFRSTRMHNTLVADGRDQSEPAGPFHWRTRTDAVTRFAASSERGAWFEAEHLGYAPAIHRRGVLLLEDGVCLVVDHLMGEDSARHEALVNWHLAPEWTSETPVDGVARLTCGGAVHHIVTTAATTSVRGDIEGLGWCAPVYGQLEPATTITARAAGQYPLTIATAIVPERTPPTLRLRVIQREDDLGTILDIITERGARQLISWTELRGGAQPRVAEWTVDGVSSRARVAVIDRSTADPNVMLAFGEEQLELASSVHAKAP